jgi:hypothetical protein
VGSDPAASCSASTTIKTPPLRRDFIITTITTTNREVLSPASRRNRFRRPSWLQLGHGCNRQLWIRAGKQLFAALGCFTHLNVTLWGYSKD